MDWGQCLEFNPVMTDRGFCHSFNARHFRDTYQSNPRAIALDRRVTYYFPNFASDPVNVTRVQRSGKYEFRFDVNEHG